jgi:hypothetical protein
MVWIFNALDGRPSFTLTSTSGLFSSATEERFVDRAEFSTMEFHWGLWGLIEIDVYRSPNTLVHPSVVAVLNMPFSVGPSWEMDSCWTHGMQ